MMMTYNEALKEFKENILSNLTEKNKRDKPFVRQLWVMYVDTLHRDKRITDKAVQSWDNPF